MREIIKNIMGRTAIIFSIFYFFTPFGGWLNRVYQNILPEKFRIVNTGDSIAGTGENHTISTTGINISILTGALFLTGENSTGSIEIPENPRDYLTYLQEYGIAGIDYIEANLPKPPIIYSSEKSENNKIKDAYIARTKSVFTFPETEKEGYILFVVNGEIAENRDLFIGIDGRPKRAVRKNKSLPISEYGEYLYKMNNVIIAGRNGKGINLYDYVKNNQLWLNAFAGEKGKYVEKIIIFFK